MSAQPNFLANPNHWIPVEIVLKYVNYDPRKFEIDYCINVPPVPGLHKLHNLPLIISWLNTWNELLSDLQKTFGVQLQDVKVEAYLDLTVMGGHRCKVIPIDRIANSATVKQWRAHIVSGRLPIEARCYCSPTCYQERARGHGPRIWVLLDLQKLTSHHRRQIECIPTCDMIPRIESDLSADLSIDDLIVEVLPCFNDPLVIMNGPTFFLPLTSVDTLSKLHSSLKTYPELSASLAARNIHFGHDFFSAVLRIRIEVGDVKTWFRLGKGDGPSALLARDDKGQYYVKDHGDHVESNNKMVAQWMARYANEKASHKSFATETDATLREPAVAGDILLMFCADNATDFPGMTAILPQIRNDAKYGQTEEEFRIYLADLITIRERDIMNNDILCRAKTTGDCSKLCHVPPMAEPTAISKLFVRGDQYISELRRYMVKPRQTSFRSSAEGATDDVWRYLLVFDIV